MAYLGQAFDANTINPAADFDPVPDGEYVAMIIDSELCDTKTGSGQYLKITHQIIEGPFNGRYIFANLNIVNQSATAQQIGQSQLSAICHAVGVLHAIQDSEELHNKPMAIKVKYVPEKDGYKAKNEVSAWKAAEGQPQAPTPQLRQPAAPVARQPTPPAMAAASGARPVWARS